jgi:hypothetical protein
MKMVYLKIQRLQVRQMQRPGQEFQQIKQQSLHLIMILNLELIKILA